MQRIGVFVCWCGSNIAGTVDVKQVAEALKSEPGVVFSTEYQYMCSQAGQNLIIDAVKEHKLTGVKGICVKSGYAVKIGIFTVEFVKVNHSIPGAFALSIDSPAGIIFHTGDFKIDYEPIDGEVIDLARISEIGKKGVLLMMADSTNVEIEGSTMSEAVVKQTLDHVFADNVGKRLIIATFASNVHRLQQIS